MGRKGYRHRRQRPAKDEDGLFDALFGLSKRFPLVGVILFVIISFIAVGIGASKPRVLYGASPLIAFLVFLIGLVCLIYGIAGFVRKLADELGNSSRLQRAGWSGRPASRSPPSLQPTAGVRNSNLLTKGEDAFWRPLQQAVNGKYQIQCKVNLADVVGCDQREALGFHVDFVLCPLNSMRPVLAIELDDRSHWFPWNRRNDRYKDRMLANANVPVYRQRCQQAYDPIEIGKRIDRLIASAPS